ncbi:MAG: hypothetical protein ACO3MV_09320 [Flavobacteriales bacterium]
MNKNLRLFYLLLLVTLTAAVIRFYQNEETGELRAVDAADFAISDTASVNRIFIADKDGNTALLERTDDRYWSLNGRYKARKDATDLLLKTFLRARIKSPVPRAELDNVNRLLAGRGKKVEIYQGQEKPSKIWYIGTSTQNHTGTHMVLGDDNGGIADEPFIIHMEGFTGFLSTRFFTDEREWRYTGVFDYPGDQLRKVELVKRDSMDRVVMMELDSNRMLEVSGAQLLTRQDTIFWQDKFNLFKKVHLETYNNHLTESGVDSILNQAKPAFTLRAWTAQDTVPNEIDLYWKRPITDTYDDNGIKNEWDGSRMYAHYKGEIVLVQRFVFDPLLEGL